MNRFLSRWLAQHRAAFSLVEVTLALGIISFCLIVLLALLPVGLQTVKESRERIAAASCIEKIALAIRNAPLSGTQYQAIGGYSSLAWSVGGSTVTGTFTNISLTGDPVSAVPDQRLVAYVQVIPPVSNVSAGSALVTVAWPNSAKWNNTSLTWSHAVGSLSNWIIFNPTIFTPPQ